MFDSRSLLSRKGPLGAIWVAAYCFKRLKKAQIFETNIPSSVDGILEEELDVMTYRVLAYLLLGLVRIYSKKVEYLFDECNDVMIKIKNFVISEKSAKNLETRLAPYYSITLPDSFELDAFELEILEDVRGENVLPLEEITLKDGASTAGEKNQFSQAKHYSEEFAACHDFCSADYSPIDEIFSSHLMEIGMAVTAAHDLSKLEASLEKLQSKSLAQEQRVNHDKFCGTGGEKTGATEPFEEDHQTNEEKMKAPVTAQSEKGIEKIQDDRFHVSEEESLEAHQTDEWHMMDPATVQPENGVEKLQDGGLHEVQEEPLDHQKDEECMEAPATAQSEKGMEKLQDDMFCEVEEEHLDHKTNEEHMEVPATAQSGKGMEKLKNARFHGVEEPMDPIKFHRENNQSDRKQIMVPDGAHLENDACQATNKDTIKNTTNLQASVEKLLEHLVPQDSPRVAMFCGSEVEARKQVEMCGEDNHTNIEKITFMETTSQSSEHHVMTREDPLSVTVDVTPQSKFTDASGATIPEFMVVHTPALKERTRISRKRKCCFDDITVFPNDVIRRSINDSSDLVMKRRKVPHTVLAAWKASHLSSLSQGFAVTLLPCISSELSAFLCQGRLKIPETAKPMEHLHSELSTFSASIDQMAIAPETPIVRSLGKMGTAPDTPTGISLEKMAVAPDTPIGTLSEKMVVTPETPTNGPSEEMAVAPNTPTYRCSEKMAVAPDTPPGESSYQIAASKSSEIPESHENAHSIAEETLAYPYSVLKRKLASSKDEDFDLIFMNEESNTGDPDEHESHGWSARTRMVARYLHRRFISHDKKGDDEAVKLLPLLEGKTKKESARFFFEILVLQTKGTVEVKQDAAHSDIFIKKAPLWDQICGSVCL